MSLTIRPFNAEDLERVNMIETASFKDPWPKTFFTYMHGKAPDLFLVAVDEEEIAGYVVGEIRKIMFSGIPRQFNIGHILNIAVDTGHRHKGIGSSLIEEVERLFGVRNATKVTLEVRESNMGARSFYSRQGYEEIGRVRAYYPDEDAVIMSKNL